MRREGVLVALLAVLACARVIAVGSAFPFFNNIDEHRHADRVLKYARGYWPGAELPRIEPALAQLLAAAGSPEYLRKRDHFPDGRPPPPVPPDQMSDLMRALHDRKLDAYRQYVSIDAQQPPLYPLVAARAHRLAERLGLRGIDALYFVRWTNGVALAACVVVAALFLRRSHPDDPHFRAAALLWIAAFPSTVFYGVTDDVGMPALGAAAFAAVLVATARTPTRPGVAALGGLAFALALLEKWTALPFAAVAALLALAGLRRAVRAGAARREVGAWLLFGLACAIPVGLWIARNLGLGFDPLGMQLKNRMIGIDAVAPSAWLLHPLADPTTWPSFLSRMLVSFWHGEVSWMGEPLRLGWLDALYVASSFAVLALAAASCWRHRDWIRERWRVETFAFVAVAVAFGALAVMNVVYQLDPVQWRGRKFLSTGRYCTWAVLPFAIVWVRGIQVACRAAPARRRRAAFWAVVGALLAASLAGELWLTREVFASAWNFYHWPR